MLRGRTTVRVDAGGRIRLPTAFARALLELCGEGRELFITSPDGAEVIVFPLPVWDEFVSGLNERSGLDPDARKYLRLTASWGRIAPIASQNRILLHRQIRESAGIAEEAVVLGGGRHVELFASDPLKEKEHEERAREERELAASPAAIAIRLDDAGQLRVEVVRSWADQQVSESGLVSPGNHVVLLPESVGFTQDEMDEFNSLLNANPAAPESAFQTFFESYPRWLYLLGEQYEDYQSQVRLATANARTSLLLEPTPDEDQIRLRPDFLLKRVGLDLWDVLDIKRPDHKLMTGRPARRKFSELVASAAAQLREYRRRLQESHVRDQLRIAYGITVSQPVAMVLIGRDLDFRSEAEKDRFRALEGVRVYTYDDLHRLASRHRFRQLLGDDLDGPV